MLPQKSKILSLLDRVLFHIERVSIGFVCFALMAMMLIVFADVFSRYVFNAPFSWSYILIGQYLMVITFFFSVSDGYRYQAHIKIDFMARFIPLRLRSLILAAGNICGAWVIALWANQAKVRMVSAFINDDRLAASVPWPTWVVYFIVAAGSIILAAHVFLVGIRYLLFTFSHQVSESRIDQVEGTILDEETA